MRSALFAILFTACSGKSDTSGDTSKTGTDDTSTPVDTGLTQDELYAKWVNVTDAAVGDGTCYDGSTWVVETPDPACQVSTPIGTGNVTDFAFSEPVPGADVSFWYGDTVSGTPSMSATADADGLFTGNMQVCTPLVYQVATSDGSTVDTYAFQEVYSPGETTDVKLLSVLEDTWVTIPSLFGVVIDEGEGVIAGSAEDCNGDVVQNAQVILLDSDGQIPQDMVIGYTENSIPSRIATATTTDGIWMAMNVAPGQYTAEMFVSDGAGGQTLVGEAPVTAFAGSVSIASVHYGREDGVDVPDSCLSCGG